MEIYTVQEAAKQMKLNQATILKHIKVGRLKATKTSGKRGSYRITENALEAYKWTFEQESLEVQ